MFDAILKEFRERKYLVTNSDLDGILCASLLCKYFPNLTLGGFTNSKDKIWVKNEVDKTNSVYLDIFVTTPETLSIDNHIIGFDSEEIYSDLKINPNIIRNRNLQNYTAKYPFSTFIFILKILETKYNPLNIDIETIIGQTNNGENVYAWEILLRADDTLSNTFLYSYNADDWWRWILDGVNKDGLLFQLYNKLKKFVGNIDNAKYIKSKVQRFLYEKHQLSSDGFKDIVNPLFNCFVENISKCLGYKLCFDFKTKLIRLESKRSKIINKSKTKQELSNYNVKTLAFVQRDTISYSYYIK